MSRLHPAHVSLRCVPIEQWHGPICATKGGDGPFRSSDGKTQDDLRCELAAIGVEECLIQADLDWAHIRNDGMIRAGARPRTPRVSISFEHPDAGPVVFPCWAFDAFWANLRAIVMTLKHLRGVDRYGVTRGAEQYAGWRALPETASAETTDRACARLIVETAYPDDPADEIEDAISHAIEDPDFRKRAYRAASRRAHPDMEGGDEALMARITRAYATLGGGS